MTLKTESVYRRAVETLPKARPNPPMFGFAPESSTSTLPPPIPQPRLPAVARVRLAAPPPVPQQPEPATPTTNGTAVVSLVGYDLSSESDNDDDE